MKLLEFYPLLHKYANQQLRELEKDGLIDREVYAEIPPKVEYALTKKGKSVLTILEALCDWGETYCKEKICLNKLN